MGAKCTIGKDYYENIKIHVGRTYLNVKHINGATPTNICLKKNHNKYYPIPPDTDTI